MPASAADPASPRVGLIGLGLIGGSIALRTRQCFPETVVIGLDRPDRTDAAERRGAIHQAASSLADLEAVDLVVLAVPPPAMLEIVPQLTRLPAATVVTDVASTKRQVVARVLEQLAPGGHFCIGHSESLNDISQAVRQVAPSVYRKD